MNNNSSTRSEIAIAAVGMLMLLVVFASTVSAAEPSKYYLQPDNTSIPEGYCNEREVAIWINATENLRDGKISVAFDPLCGNITSSTRNASVFWMGTNEIRYDFDPPVVIMTYTAVLGEVGPGHYHIGNFTVHCNSTTYCAMDLPFVADVFPHETYAENNTGMIPIVLDNGTYTCGTPAPPETFSKPLYEGWNLISLPLDPEDNSASAVLSTVSYGAVYRYNATSKQFESIDMMNPGTGYFVHATEDCIWEYSGTPYTSMDVSLKQGLNMVGWLNCTKDIDALSSISDYYYVARWDTTTEKFEVYNPVAPSAFNDFTTMDRGTGYFISAKQDCTLSKSC